MTHIVQKEESRTKSDSLFEHDQKQNAGNVGIEQGSSTKTAWGPVMNPPHQPRSGELYIKKQLMFFFARPGYLQDI